MLNKFTILFLLTKHHSGCIHYTCFHSISHSFLFLFFLSQCKLFPTLTSILHSSLSLWITCASWINATTTTITIFTSNCHYTSRGHPYAVINSFYRKILQASIRANKTGHFIFVGSDSWGAKSHPVRDQEFAAVNTITVLPQRTNLDGKLFIFHIFIVNFMVE